MQCGQRRGRHHKAAHALLHTVGLQPGKPPRTGKAWGAQVVVGAVGRVLRVERCERLQLVAAAARILITSCHDCVFYLGVNRPPLLLGDNRFLQARSRARRSPCWPCSRSNPQ